MKKLAVLLLVLIALVGVCSAQAEVDEVTITVNVVDINTQQPVNKQIVFRHAQCYSYRSHTPETCNCFDPDNWHMGANNAWCSAGLTPCDCGENWSPYTQSSAWTTSTFTCTIKTGHKYLLFPNFNTFGYSEYHCRQTPAAYIYADPETGSISFIKNGVNLSQINSNTFQISLEPRLESRTVKIDAAKLMDGKDPGELRFAFKVWSLTDEQMESLMLWSLVTEDELPEWKDEYDNMTMEEAYAAAFSPELRKTILSRALAVLEKYPSTIVYNEGSTIPFINNTYNAYNVPEYVGVSGNYVIAEINQTGNGICEDDAVFGISYRVSAFYPTLPSNLEDDMTDQTGYDRWFDVPQPIGFTYGPSFCYSSAGQFYVYEFAEDLPADPASRLVFRNTTCTMLDPKPDAAIPATGDGGFPIYWAALLLAGVMVMILRPRRA